MKQLDLQQGSPAWRAHRLAHFNASDAAAMMGVGKYQTRTQLLRVLAGLDFAEVSPDQQRLFDRGHAAEAAARPKIEALLGEDLFPAVGVSEEHPKLSASFDGVTMDERTGYECKLWSEGLAEQVRSGNLEPHYVWQMEQQALVAGLDRIIFVVASEDASSIEHMEYRPQPSMRERLLAGWAQFERDLAEFAPVAAAPDAVGRAPESLPALRLELNGSVVFSNLDVFKERAIAVFRGIKTELSTDQDFADADRTVKWCGEIEDKLLAAKAHALSQTQSIDALFRAIDEIGAEARAKRLELEKLVKGRKESVRFEIMQRARDALSQHVQTINATLEGVTLAMPPSFATDLALAIKGKKTVASFQDAADTALAGAKIEASRIADQVRINLRTLADAGHPSLFADRQQLVIGKAPEDLRNLVSARIAQHQVEEQARLDRDRDRIRAEETARANRDAERLAESERARIRSEEAAKLKEAAPAPAAPVAAPAAAPARPYRSSAKLVRPSDAAIVAVLASHFGAREATVIEWLHGFAQTPERAATSASGRAAKGR